MSAAGATLLSILMIAALLLGGAGMWLLVRRRDLKRGLLMLVAGLVMLANVIIWIAPLPQQ